MRDDIGRTYVAGPVSLPALSLSALQAVVAAAASSGVKTLEAAVVVTGRRRRPGGARWGSAHPAVHVVAP